MEYNYESLKNTYASFEHPALKVTVEGRDMSKHAPQFVIGEARIELTSGCEASQAVWRIYGCVDEKDGSYLFEEMKPYILLGSYVSLEIGYGENLTEVFRGFIARVRFEAEEEDIPCAEVTAVDAKGALMSGRYSRQLRAGTYGEAVKELVNGEGYRELFKKGAAERIQVTDTPDKKENKEEVHLEQVSESDFTFIAGAAKRFGYEFFAETGTLVFRKAREGAKELLELGPGRGVISADISYDIRGLAKEVEVRGMDDGKGEPFSAKRSSRKKLSYGALADTVTGSAKQVYTDAAIRSKEEAGELAEALADRQEWRFGTLQCDCIGLPVLLPGNFVIISGYGKGADNQYYVTAASHILSGEEGYITRLEGYAASVL